ncbi:MAG: sigma 54-interacting transcriptional regulator [Planctomycetota bacterium]
MTQVSNIRKKIRHVLDVEKKQLLRLSVFLSEKIEPENILEASRLEHKSEKDKTKRAVIRNLIATVHLNASRIDEALNESLPTAEDGALPNTVRAHAFGTASQILMAKEQYTQAGAYIKKALALCEDKDSPIFAFVLNIIGSIHLRRQKHHLALEYYKLYLETARRAGDKRQEVAALNNIALSYDNLGREEEALAPFLETRRIGEEEDNTSALALAMHNLGGYYLDQDKLDKALSESEGAYQIYRKLKFEWMYANCLNDIAEIYRRLGKLDIAFDMASNALDVAEKHGQKRFLSLSHMRLASILADKKNPLAKEHFEKSIRYYQEQMPETEGEGIEYAFLGYGKLKTLIGDEDGPEYIQRAEEILYKRPKRKRVRRALEKIKTLRETLPEGVLPPQEQIFEEVQKERDNFKKVLEISKAINLETELEKLLEQVLDTAIDTSGAERGFVALIENGSWEVACQRNFFTEIEKDPDYRAIDEILTKVSKDGSVFTVGDLLQRDSLGGVPSENVRALRGVFAFPLVTKERIMGSVYLDSRFAILDLSPGMVGFISTLMEQAAHIVDKTRLYDEVRELSKRRGEKIVKQSAELEHTRHELEKKQKELEFRFSYKNIIGRGAKMQELFRLLDKIVETDLPIYIYGESGTGKELVAKAIHYNGARKEKYFVAINCASIPESLFESELFGYEKGSFTGADSAKIGLFETADGGTIFLDEVANMSMPMQQKLLRVLQEKEVRKIGASTPKKIDVRIITASNVDLRDMANEGSFRQDLFYRLKVLSIKLPSLKERKEDIPLLVDHFWEIASGSRLQHEDENVREILSALMDYDWPGNVRELENEIHRLSSLCGGIPDVKYLSENITRSTRSGKSADLMETEEDVLPLDEMEIKLIQSALAKAGGNKAKAARLLGIPRTSFRNKLRKYKLEATEKR